MLLMQTQENSAVLDEEELLFLTGEQTNNFDADVDDHPVGDLALIDDNIFQADECDAFDLDVDDKPTARSIFMANLSSDEPTNQQAGPSNALILFEDEHEIHNEVQQKNIIYSTKDHMGNSNVTPYEQYLSINDVFVVPSCASSILNDAYVLHDKDAYVPHDPLVTELNIYKEQLAIYEQRARFELRLREQKMDEQMSILIQDRDQKEENIKKELHSTQLTPKQVFWSKEIIAKKANDLKARTLPLPVLPSTTMYPPNMPVHLVPRTLLTTSQVNIGLNNREVHLEYLKHLKESVATIRKNVEESRVERPLDSSLASACLYTKCSQELVEYAVGTCPKDFNKRDKKQATTPLTRKKQDRTDRPLVGTVRFRNNHFGAIMGYGDYVLGASVISRVYYVEGLGHNLFSVEAVATACYTQNRSLIRTLHNKTPYELVHDKKLDLSCLRVFGALCYPTNNSEDLGKLKAKAGIGLFLGYAPNRKGYRIYNKRTRQIMETIHFRARTNPAPAIPYVPPTKKELKILFQLMFDEYFKPSFVDQQVPPAPAVHILVNPPCPSVSISIDQDASLEGHSPSSSDHQCSFVHHGVADDHSLEVNPFSPADNEPFFNIFALDPNSEVSSFEETSIADFNQSTQPHEYL
nr:hypothetical protein [Tanacetum cinerariifolium]